MGHSIYAGSFAALEKRWSEIVAELQQDDPLLEINVLIGSNILASYLKRSLAQNGRAAANIRFHTFLDLTARLASASASAQAEPRLPHLGASIILENLLASNAPPVYASLTGYPGFRDALLDTFRDLRDAGIGPQELDLAIQRGKGNPDRGQNLLALAELYRSFRDSISLFHDVDDDFRSAIHCASHARQSLGLRQLLVYGIYDATGQQSNLLTALKDSLEMIYFIPLVDDSASDFARPFLEKRAHELGVKCNHIDEELPANSLGNLAARGFGLAGSPEFGRGGSLAADGSFALVSAPGESRAAIEIVREIFRAVRDGTIRGFHEAAVILRKPESDIPILTEMLRLRGVPYFVHGGAGFGDRPISKAVVALCGLESNGYSRESVFTAMELVGASLSEASVPAWDVQSWRALTNGPGFIDGLKAWDGGAESLIERARQDLLKAETIAAESMEEEESERSVQSIHLAGKRLETAKSFREGWRILRQATADWPAYLSWKDWAHFLEHRLEPILGTSEDWRSFSTVLDDIASLQTLEEIPNSRFEILDSTASAPKEKQVSVERLRAALRESIASLSYPIGRFQRSGVNLLSTSAARGLRFPLVIIPGLDEGRFPAKLRQDPLLLDSERMWMKSLPIKSRRVDEEKLLFDMTARSAGARLVLMTSRLEEGSDREHIPSQFFLRVAAAIQGSIVSMRDLSRGIVPGFRSVSLDNPAPMKDEIAVDEGEIRLRLVTLERGSARTALAALAKLEPSRLSRPLAYDHARWNKKLTGFDGCLSDPVLFQWVAQKMGPAAGQVSASRVEEYVKCPYYFFLKRVMDLEAWEEQKQTEGMDPLERGLAIHSILESFLRGFCGEIFLTESSEKLGRSLESHARDILEKSRPAGIPDLLWEIERDSLLAMLMEWLAFENERADKGMLVSQLERAFGEFSAEERHPAFRLQAGKHTFEFRGRIDRVDVSRDGRRARVVDYKTGALPDSMASKTRTPLMSGERIQIAVYRGALSVMNEFKSVEIVEGEYLHLQPRDAQIIPCSFTNEELQEASDALPGILEIVGDGIENGVFFARTKGMIRPLGHCDFCDYLPVCGKDRVQREERKAKDPAVRNFYRVLETSL